MDLDLFGGEQSAIGRLAEGSGGELMSYLMLAVTVIVILILMFFLLPWILADQPVFAHKHKYLPIAVKGWGESECTFVLVRCKCSDVQVKTLAGRWTLEEIIGDRKLINSEIDQLRKMSGIL